jgi:sirohydrochlorin ferrochelatase
MTAPTLLLVAHGTRDPAGAVVTEQVAERVRQALGVPVAACFADVRRPTPADVLAELPGPCVAVPMFLAAGYHVRVDVPAQLAATGRGDVVLAETFGPDPVLVAAAAQRLAEAGAEPDDAVVLAVIGSSDPHAQADSARAALLLGRLLGRPVTTATVAIGGPRVHEAVARLRRDGARRVAIASWLLAPGLFHRQLGECGADVVGAPLADHDAVIELVADRYRTALAGATARTA